MAQVSKYVFVFSSIDAEYFVVSLQVYCYEMKSIEAFSWANFGIRMLHFLPARKTPIYPCNSAYMLPPCRHTCQSCAVHGELWRME